MDIKKTIVVCVLILQLFFSCDKRTKTNVSQKVLKLPITNSFSYLAENDTLSVYNALLRIDSVCLKIENEEEFSPNEVKFIIKLMNSCFFADESYSNQLNIKFKNLQVLRDAFKAQLEMKFIRDYAGTIGKGGSIIFNSLEIKYTGDLLSCSRIIILEIHETTVFNYSDSVPTFINNKKD